MKTKMLCLGVLSLGDASGYDIGKKLDQTFGNFIDVASSGVYPVLKTLHEEGLVECEVLEQDGSPNKKMYSLTNEGRITFKEALSELPPRHKIRSQFILLLFFADMLSETRLRDVIAERKSELEHWMQLTNVWMECQDKPVGQTFTARYALEVMGTEIRFLEENLESLMTSLNEEKSGEIT